MAGIPFLSKVLALAGISVKNQTDNKEVLINVSSGQATGSTLTVDLPSISGQLLVASQAVLASEKGANNGVATLDAGGKIPSSQLPPLTITSTYVVSSQAAMLALPANVGDIAIRTDINQTFILQTAPASVLGNWVEILSSEGVQSVNGQTGPAVTLNAASVGAVAKAGDTMTGILTMGPVSTGAGETGQIAFRELAANGIYSVTLRAPDQLSDYVVLTLPASHGSAGQVLQTDGSGVLSWVTNTPADVVTSVNGQSGPSVVLTAASVGAVAKAGDTMSGALIMGPSGTLSGQAGKISFRELAANGTDSVSLVAPDALSGSVSFTLPASDGSAGQVLTTNGSGVLSFASIPSAPVSSVNGRTGAVSVKEIASPTLNSTYVINTWNGSISGSANTSYGANAVYAVTTGNGNSGFGVNALAKVTQGQANTAIGTETLANLTGALANSSYNVAVGQAAFQVLGTGRNNTAVGYLAGIGLSNGSYNTFINANASAGSISGAVAIGMDSAGNYSQAGASDQFVLGTSLHKYRLPGVVETALVLGPTSASAGAGGVIQFRELAANGSNYVALKAADSISANVTWTLPAADGSAGQILSTDGSGTLSWTAAIPSGVVTSVNGYSGPSVTLSAADVGAVAKTGDTMSGSLTVAVGGNNTQIFSGGITYFNAGQNILAQLGVNGIGYAVPGGDSFFTWRNANPESGRTPSGIFSSWSEATTGKQTSITPYGIRFYEKSANGDNYIGLKSADSLGSNIVFTLPSADGTSGQVLVTDGSGVLSFTSFPSAPVLSVNGLTGAVTITPSLIGAIAKAGDTMTGALVMDPIGALSGQTGVIRLKELAANGSHSVSIRAADSMASDLTLTLPGNAGSSGYVLTTNGSGGLSWSAAVDSALTARVEKLEASRGIYTGTLSSNQELDISSLVGASDAEYPIVQIYKLDAGVQLQVNVEFSFNPSTKTITFGEVIDGPIDAVIHVLALTQPYTAL
ncbi:MAG: hypothetical protein EBZ61_06590 [Micrococcales bacterium]|nr:hypothetical protein [Micrococcales bacterium]